MYESDKMYHQLIPSEFKHSWFETFSTYSQQLQNAIESVKNVYKNTKHTLMSVDVSDKECSICLELLQGESISCCYCGHYFHNKCINKWLKNHDSCPYCRSICNKIIENEQIRQALDVFDDDDLTVWNKCEPADIIQAIGMVKMYGRTNGQYLSSFDNMMTSLVTQMRQQNIQGPLLLHEILHLSDETYKLTLLTALMSPWGHWLSKSLLNIEDDNGKTPLYIAAQQGNIEAVKLLLIVDTENLKEAMVVAYENNKTEIFEIIYRNWIMRNFSAIV